ncbi:thyrotropin-releasing hormone-degrading ectoenzyme-like isoform X2 [Pseudomyrmex gracilis]|uniref:thyrotropin-releasing hormone-degrading ectoenzyme-like isoform X2 n=1 Tax=Pseudomyrmex gracilis TaxID=219809 RepID=UPI0009953FF6|nr:thyrotropin-releasing hormone-degrading ectoenzyme-like isoform X2 [Pseudomyrmex gracilis]
MREIKIGMAFLRLLLLSNTLVFIAVTNLDANVSCAENHEILSKSLNVTPEHYNVKLITDIERGVFIGECNATFVHQDTKQSIGFHVENLIVTKARLIEQDSQVSKENIFAIHEPIRRLDDYLERFTVLYFNHTLSSGRYVLMTEFSGNLTDKDGFFRTSCIDSTGKKTWMAATRTQTGDAPRVFPCWNNPEFKTTFNISVRHHKTYMALSNMPIRASEEDERDTIWTHFRTTPAMSTYSVAVVVMPQFVSKRNPSFDNVVMWSRSHIAPYTDFASDIAGRVARYLEDEQRLNSSLRVPEVNHVAISGLLPYKTVATLGLILYREEDIIYRNEFSVAHKYNVARLVMHQVAHQWILLFTNPLRWSSAWLYGAAEFFGLYALEKTIPDSKIMNLFVIQTQHESLHLDVGLMEPIESKTSIANSTYLLPAYIKVPAILRMLQNIFTENIFWESMQNSLKQGKNYPLMMNHESPHGGPLNDEYRVSQGSFIRGGHNIGYYTPFTYTEENRCDFETSWPERSESVWLRPGTSFPFIVSKSSNWFICNVQQIGYYRVNYPIHNWIKIVHYLRTSDHKKIHVLNRAQIIDDFYHFMKEKQVEVKMIFEDLIQYLSIETDYEAWYPMIRMLEDFSGITPYPSTWLDGIKRFLSNIVNELLRNISFENDPDEHEFRTCLRQEAIKWACLFNDSKCIEMVTARLNNSLSHSKRNDSAPLPMWDEWMYCTGLQTGDKYIWDRLLSIYKSTRNPAILKALPCIYVVYEDGKRFINNPARLHTEHAPSFLNDSSERQIETFITFENGNFTNFVTHLRDDLNLTINEEVILLQSLVAKLGGNRHVLRQIINNLESIKPRNVTFNAVLCIIINHIYVSDKADMITLFSEFIDRLIYEIEHGTLYVGDVSSHDLTYILIKDREIKNLNSSIITSKINSRYSQMKNYIEDMKVFFDTPNMITDPFLKL